jgi:hypothetical protein
MSLEVGSLGNPTDVQDAINEILDGGLVATQYHGVFIVVFSASDRWARKRVVVAKGEVDSTKPLTSMSFYKFVSPYVDHDRILESTMRELVEDVDRYRRTFGAMCHVRVPLASDATEGPIPPQIVSGQDEKLSAQCLDPYGNLLFTHLVHELNEAGIDFVTASSLNCAGENEICDLSAARSFCEANDVPVVLYDPLFAAPDVQGSFPIVDSETMTAIRDGHIPIQIIERIVGLEFDKSSMKPAKYPHSDHLISLLGQQELKGSALRRSVLDYLYGGV